MALLGLEAQEGLSKLRIQSKKGSFGYLRAKKAPSKSTIHLALKRMLEYYLRRLNCEILKRFKK